MTLSAAGLTEQIGLDARRLSSGQRQRLALARALAHVRDGLVQQLTHRRVNAIALIV